MIREKSTPIYKIGSAYPFNHTTKCRSNDTNEKRHAKLYFNKKRRRQTFTTVWLNQEMRPYLLRYPAIAISAANHVRVSQATDSAKHSFHVTTPVTRRTDNPRIAAVTASTFSTPPKIHSPT